MFEKKRINHPSLSDEELMRLVFLGERQAFETIYDRYFGKLVWFARGFVEDTQQAEDLVQDVFIKLIEKPERFDAARKFSTWIYVVTSNACRQSLRNTKNRSRILEENRELFGPQQIVFSGSSADDRLLKEKMTVVYSELSDKEKNIYTLRFEQELSINEIAAIMSIPEGSVKSGIFYLLKKLAYQLKDFSYEN